MLGIFLALASLIVIVAPASAQDVPALFSSAPADAAPSSARANPAFVSRAAFVRVNLGLLLDSAGKARPLNRPLQVSLDLLPGVSYTGVINKTEKSFFGDTWIGALKGKPNSYFYLEVVDRVFIAHIASPDGIFEVSSVGGGIYKVVQIDQSKFVDDYPNPRYDLADSAPPAADASLDSTADSANRIDVMVVYTQAALTAEGSLAALKARIALAMTETNQGYDNAGVTTNLRLVHIEKVTYTESGNIFTDLNRLQGTTDGFMDNVHALRNKFAADMVALVVENGGGQRSLPGHRPPRLPDRLLLLRPRIRPPPRRPA